MEEKGENIVGGENKGKLKENSFQLTITAVNR